MSFFYANCAYHRWRLPLVCSSGLLVCGDEAARAVGENLPRRGLPISRLFSLLSGEKAGLVAAGLLGREHMCAWGALIVLARLQLRKEGCHVVVGDWLAPHYPFSLCSPLGVTVGMRGLAPPV